MIKTSSHKINLANSIKLDKLSSFIDEYRIALQLYIDYIWNNTLTYNSKSFSIKDNLLDCPQFISTKNIDITTNISSRALKCAATQACGMVRSAVFEKKKLLFVRNNLLLNNKRTRSITNKINKITLLKPSAKHSLPELNSICCKISNSNNSFNKWITLSSIGKTYGKIIIPINDNKYSNKLINSNYTLMNSILISKSKVHLRYNKVVDLKKSGAIVGADSGISSVITLSNNQQSVNDRHGHSLNSILNRIQRKEKGSKSFKRALSHRDNFINWSINQLNLSGIKQINLEEVSNFRYKNNVGRFLNYSGESLIRQKVQSFAEEHGVRVHLQSSPYRSQRCSKCSYVSNKNRTGKLFSCKRCSFRADADYNASCNHEQKLPCSKILLGLKGHKKEFFWNEKGFFDLEGRELTVPATQRIKKLSKRFDKI